MARPPFSKYGLIGQKRIITYLDEMFEASLAARETAPATLLVGPQGCGKTTIARGLAEHYKGRFKTVVAAKDVTPVILCGWLAGIEYGDTLFIDEVHALPGGTQELFYPVIDHLKRPVIKDGKLDRSERASIAPFNFLCATTEPGRLLAPFRSRMEIIFFDPNSRSELRAIAINAAAEAGRKLSPQGGGELADRCQESPRIVKRMAQQLVRLTPSTPELTQDHVRSFLRKKGISSHGLDPLQQQYLLALSRFPGHRSMFERLASHLPAADAAFVRQEAEPFLVAMGAVVIEARYRLLTKRGREIVEQLKAEFGIEDEEDTDV
ncbi:MAG: holliday junction helicase RuvB [Thermoanaerobaculia bacterium]|jgi:Holliday junction DNA helicase RuvB|nr:holliday junction helicase RuvB [Thermoanaerobaculia bacterium]